MSGVYGKNVTLTIFGESHGPAIGGVITSLPPGEKIDFSAIDKDLSRRNHRAVYSTARAEADKYEILSGVDGDTLTGAPLAFIIRNADTKSGDYSQLKELMRPGHSDYPAYVKYKGANDVRGGGHFSGRLTAVLVFAGSLARQLLKRRGIDIFSHITSIGSVKGKSIVNNMPPFEKITQLQTENMPVLDDSLKESYINEIKKYTGDGNSVGGTVECCILNMPAGIGDPFFHSLESELSSMIFSVPAVKGIEFGLGFAISESNGYEANDSYRYENGKVVALTNNNGGILGGITNGMPVIFKAAIKPTPSIFKPQETVNVKTKTNGILTLKGRHDSCIVPRAAAAIECAAAFTILDVMGADL